jgi:hypothetical protein
MPSARTAAAYDLINPNLSWIPEARHIGSDL